MSDIKRTLFIIGVYLCMCIISCQGLLCDDCAGKKCPWPGECTTNGKCFIRRDPDGNVYRGCADSHRWPGLDLSYNDCKSQTYGGWSVGGLFTYAEWCLCDDADKCNTNKLESMIGKGKGRKLACAECSGDACDNPGKCRTRGKCFIRRDPNGLVYRGCADSERYQGLDTSYTHCKRQKYGGWPVNTKFVDVEWCFCKDSDMCNEKHLKDQLHLDCRGTVPGRDYIGRINTTVTGHACQSWSLQKPHNHVTGTTDAEFQSDGGLLNAENFCRNPDSDPGGPWCYVDDDRVLWEYCNIPLCSGGSRFCRAKTSRDFPKLDKDKLAALRQNITNELMRLIEVGIRSYNEQTNQTRAFFEEGIDRKMHNGPNALHLAFLKTRPEVHGISIISDERLNIARQIAERLGPSVQLSDLGLQVPLRCPFQDGVQCNTIQMYRSADGKCNNIRHPLWGSALTPMPRFLQARYGDLTGSPRVLGRNGKQLPSARKVSLTVHQQSRETDADPRFTYMLMQWGQFLDHDIDFTPITKGFNESDLTCCPENFTQAQMERIKTRKGCFPILMEKGDPLGRCMNFARSASAPNSHCLLGYREQLNQITSYIDGSNVYGSSKEHTRFLRSHTGGRLVTSDTEGHFPPKDVDNKGNCILPKDHPHVKCYIAGDERANEQIALTSLHTTWLREHNRIADEIASINPQWSDERIFQETRKIIGALLQRITYNEFLDVLLGSKGKQDNQLDMEKTGFFRGYDDYCDASIRNSFATAAYRMGHSLIRSYIKRVSKTYHDDAYQHVRLRHAYFRPGPLYNYSQGSIDSIMRGLVSDSPSRLDGKLTKEVTTHLFEDPITLQGLDLAALNIQRGRDHGLPAYNEFRAFCSERYPQGKHGDMFTGRAKNFNHLRRTHSKNDIKLLKRVYKHVDDIDLFPGLITERPLPHGIVGPTLSCLLGHQFHLLRFADRFWHETAMPRSRFTLKQLGSIRKVTLAGILCNNLDIDKIQPQVFHKVNDGLNQLTDCNLLKSQLDVSLWKHSKGVARQYDDADDITIEG